jgi:ElaB/YqjD/DUF883 family membrane-anchored ribosome-binding protein
MRTSPSEKKIRRIEALAAKSIEKTRRTVNQRLDKASRKIAVAADRLREKEHAALNSGNGVLDRARDLVDEKAQLLAEKTRHASELAQNGYGQVRDLGVRARVYTRENPVKSAAIAMGLGLVTGLAIRQARS